jgi:acyl dehydratase
MVGARFHFTWQVERGKIGELLIALGETNPIYRDVDEAKAEGYQDIVAPPTFSTIPVLWSGVIFRALDELKIPLSRVMHAEQGYEYFDPILPGDTLHGVVEVKSIIERQGKTGPMDFVLFETVFTNQHGRQVVKDEMLVVERK